MNRSILTQKDLLREARSVARLYKSKMLGWALEVSNDGAWLRVQLEPRNGCTERAVANRLDSLSSATVRL